MVLLSEKTHEIQQAMFQEISLCWESLFVIRSEIVVKNHSWLRGKFSISSPDYKCSIYGVLCLLLMPAFFDIASHALAIKYSTILIYICSRTHIDFNDWGKETFLWVSCVTHLWAREIRNWIGRKMAACPIHWIIDDVSSVYVVTGVMWWHFSVQKQVL